MQVDDWLLSKYLFSDSSLKSNGLGNFQTPSILEDVRQGGILSTSHCKRYNNPLLLHLENAYSDVKIGSINITHITVADDLAVLPRNKRVKMALYRSPEFKGVII